MNGRFKAWLFTSMSLTRLRFWSLTATLSMAGVFPPPSVARQDQPATILHAAHLLDVEGGILVSPGEVLVRGQRIAEIGRTVTHPINATNIDLGQATLMPGLVDAHVHLFLHPGDDEDTQAIRESVPERTIRATLAARADLMAGFTAERDMGTEGAGSAISAVRDAIESGLIPGPRLRISGNAISVLGGHEDALGFNPAEHLLSKADYADSTDELIATIRRQVKEGADNIKIYETGHDQGGPDGRLHTPYQFTEAQLAAAIAEATRLGIYVAVHATGEPGTLYAAQAGVSSIDHAYQIGEETMHIMREKQIYAVPTFTISEYVATHGSSPASEQAERTLITLHNAEFKHQVAAGVPMAVGSDVGPFPHGTQARELELMVQNGMSAPNALRADLLNGARLLRWAESIGQLKPGFYADVIAVDGNPLQDISSVTRVCFVMKNGTVYKQK